MHGGREVPGGSPSALRATARRHGRGCLCAGVQIRASAGRGRQRGSAGDGRPRGDRGPGSDAGAQRLRRRTVRRPTASGWRSTPTASATSWPTSPGSTPRSRATPSSGPVRVRFESASRPDHGHCSGSGPGSSAARRSRADEIRQPASDLPQPSGERFSAAGPGCWCPDPSTGPAGRPHLRAHHSGDVAGPGHRLRSSSGRPGRVPAPRRAARRGTARSPSSISDRRTARSSMASRYAESSSRTARE